MRTRSQRRQKRSSDRKVALETKWGWGPCIDQGWSAVPSALLRFAADIGLSASEGWLLIQLLDLKWSAVEATASLLSERCHMRQNETLELLQSLNDRHYLRFNSKMILMRSSSRPTKSRRRSALGWEIDLSPLIRLLNDFVMREGDVTAGFLHFSEKSEGESTEAS